MPDCPGAAENVRNADIAPTPWHSEYFWLAEQLQTFSREFGFQCELHEFKGKGDDME